MIIRNPFLMFMADDAEGSSDAPEVEQPVEDPNGDQEAQAPAGDAPAAQEDEIPAWARKSLEKANAEAARYRTEAKQAKADAEAREKEFAQKIGKAIGLVEDDAEPSVDSLTATLQDRDKSLSDAQAALQAQRAENAVLRYAAKHKGNADALLDSRGFEKKLAAIDTTADDYAAQVEALVKAEVESNPSYRSAQVAPANSNGAPAPSGSATGGQLTREQLAALTPEERLKAAREGRIAGVKGKN